MVVLVVSAVFFTRTATRDGTFGASEYGRVRESLGTSLLFMPANLPAGATRVAIYARHLAFNIFPGGGTRVTVAFQVPPADARALLLAAEREHGAVAPRLHASALRRLDDDSAPGSTRVVLTTPSKTSIGGVTINPATGDVMYWYNQY